MQIIFFSFIFLISYITCLFDEELIMKKPLKGSALFFRGLNNDEYYISNSETNIIFNIRNGSIKNFTGIIPLESTINEPFVLFVNYVPSFFVDAHTIDNFIKIYDIKNNKYRAYTGLKIEDEYKRKFCKFNIANDNKFVVGVQDSNDHFQIRLITANGTEVFQSQILNIKGSDDFFIFTNIYQNSKYNNRAIVALIFYENQFVMHQWARTKNGNVVYTSDKAKSNQFVKQNNVQMSEGNIFCGQEYGDVNCHIIIVNHQGGFNTKQFNTQMLQECKTNYKLNKLNYERYVVSCLNTKNEFIIQLFSSKLVRDYGMNGMVLFNDDINDNYTYDVLKGKDNELVVLKADLSKNKYFIETFNFIKNQSNLYTLCPTGCQDCYFKQQLGIQYGKNYITRQTLNCSLCKFNSYFADDYADLCFLKKTRPRGYEFMEDYKKFSTCDYCCITNKTDYICDVCLNVEKYEYFVDEPNNGRCEQKCSGNYRFIKTDKKVCTNSCTGVPNCNTFSTYLKMIANNSDY